MNIAKNPKETKKVQINKQKVSRQAGFGILEVIVTMLIIGITLLLFQVVSNSVVLNKYNRYKEIALRIAEDKIQELRTTPNTSLPSSGPFTNSLLSSMPQGAGTIEITQEADGLSKALVTVSWMNPQGTDVQKVTLSTYLWKWGLGK